MAGVSVTTVSRVLNVPEVVRPEKVAAVQRAIAQLGFTPNRTARSLKSKTFATIALVVTDISNMFFAEIAKVFEAECDERGYSMLLCNLDTREDRLIRLLRELPQRGIDGIIVCGSAHMSSPKVQGLLQDIAVQGPPLVATGYQIEGFPFPAVVNDSLQALDDLAAHLQASGRSRVAFLSGPHHSAIVAERRDTFVRAAREHGLTVDSDLIVEIGYDFEAGFTAVQRLVADGAQFDALVCSGDQMAIGGIRGLKEAGLRVPDDVAVIGFDNTKVGAFSDPPLSSISVNLEAIAATASSRLFDVIAGNDVETHTVVPCTLVIRESS